MILTAIRERIAIDVVRWAPKGLYSAAIGWGARQRLPRPVRSPFYQTFARIVGARLDEAELPIAEYPTFGEFFARRLRAGVREVARDPAALTAPCDGAIAAVGEAVGGRMIQAKGRDYSLADLVMNDEWARTLEGGTYAAIYLSPRDYHRVHSPVSARLVGYDYVPGSFFPVNPFYSRSIDRIMARNERVVFYLASEWGAAAVVMVGALAVSNIQIARDSMETRQLRKVGQHRTVRFNEPVAIARGDELGAFHLGSTVILVFGPGAIELHERVRVGATVRFGEPLGRVQMRGNHTSPASIVR